MYNWERVEAGMSSSPVRSLSPSSPSFNSYSSSSVNLAEIAARVVEEFRHNKNNGNDEDFNFESDNKQEEEEEEEEEEFEFAVLCNNNSKEKQQEMEEYNTADKIFFNGQIRAFYPLFNRDYYWQEKQDSYSDNNKKSLLLLGGGGGEKKTKRLPLGELMMSEEANSVSCSSSEAADDLDNLQPGTYCVWNPKSNKESSSSSSFPCKKSNSTGTTTTHSKRWNKFRDLLYRSNSTDRKDQTFLFFKKSTPVPAPNYGSIKDDDEDKKRSNYMPYRQDLLGFFHAFNTTSTTPPDHHLHPFLPSTTASASKD